MPVVPVEVPGDAPLQEPPDAGSRIVLLVGHCDDRAAARLAAQLMALDATPDDTEIELHVATRSAELEAALLVADVVGATVSPVVAVARGIVGGAALAPFAAASRRTGSRHVLFELVEPVLADGPEAVRDLPAVADAFAHRAALLHGWVAGATGRPTAEVAEHFRAGRSMNASEALRYGLLDDLTDGPRRR